MVSSAVEDKISGTGKAEKQAEKHLLAVLEELGGQRVADDAILSQGNKVILPSTMTPRAAIKFLEQHIAQMDEVTTFSRVYGYRPWDGASALQTAMKKAFGTTGIAVATMTMFGKNPPELIDIQVALDKTAQVPWGRIEFPPLEATLILEQKSTDRGLLFLLYVQAPRKYKGHIEGLFKLVEEELRSNSIYRGQAINGAEQPTFIDPYVVDRNKVIYSTDVEQQLEANIWSLLKHSDAMVRLEVPLKRAVLLSGPYGTGKSLAAMLTAQIAVQNGWTFIQCRPGKDDLGIVMQTALLYQPAVVFYEDVDTIAQGGDPDKIARLLDMFDGITAKGTKLIVVLTTNHAEAIHKGMVRPGRLDSVIEIGALDSPGVEALIKATVPEYLLDKNLDFEEIGKAMEDFLPAFIREAIDRAVRYAIARTNGKPDTLTTNDFVLSAHGLRPQLDLMNGASEGKGRPDIEVAIKEVVKQVATATLNRSSIRGVGQIQVADDTPVVAQS